MSEDTHLSPAEPTEAAGTGLILDEFLPYLFNRITNRLNQDLLADLRPLRVSVPRWRVLAVLQTLGPRRMGALSAYTVIEQSSLSRVVDQMERDGLVVRRYHPDDNRVIEVHLTDEGSAMFARIYPLAQRHYERAVEGLSAQERQTLVALLHKILENTRQQPYP